MGRARARRQAAAATPARVEERAHRAPRGRVIPDLSLWSQFNRIGGSLTPIQVSSIIREADTGEMRRLCDLANEARQKDCHLQSVLATSEEAIAGLPWELELPDKPKAREKRAAKAVEAALRETSLARLFAHHAGARFYGYAVSEIVWRRSGRMLVPDRYEHLAPRRFAFRQDTGAFVWRDEGMARDGVDLRDHPNKFVISQPRVTGDVPAREGLVRVLMWAALFRNWTIADWLKLAEIAWKPWRLGRYLKSASTEDKDILLDILEGLAGNGVAVYPETTEVQIQWPTGGGTTQSGTHSQLSAVMAAEMSKAVLGQTLTTEAGRVGTQALGKVQNEVRKDLREATARYVADDVNRDVIAPIFALNWGAAVRPSRLKFLTDDAQDLVQFSRAVSELVGAGLAVPAKWVRDEIGAPEPEADDEVLGGSNAPMAEPQGAGADAAGDDEMSDDAIEPDAGDGDVEPEPEE